MALLEIRELTVSFATRRGRFVAVEAVDLTVDADEVLAIVGESGSGKSVAMLAVMGLLPWTASVRAKTLRFDGRDLLGITPRQRRSLVGRDLAMIFQEPASSLNPCFTIGFQIGEALARHEGLDGAARRRRVAELLELVGIGDAANRAGSFPHQLSGGMNQRVMIAMALACKPKLLIADEPTTALDVTIQAQIMDLLRRLRTETGLGMVLVTHDMGIVAESADRTAVMYAGQVIETRETAPLFADPHHPYTSALLAALPERAHGRRLPAIKGSIPGQNDRPAGCAFSPRCGFATDLCRRVAPLPAFHSPGAPRCHTPLAGGAPTPPLLAEVRA